MVRERGIIAALAIAACTALIVYTAGFLLNLLPGCLFLEVKSCLPC